MRCPISIAIHPSQFPQSVRSDLLESLRTRKVNHKFHYDSIKQTQKWLALHQAYSPSRTDANCLQVYDQSFAATATHLGKSRIHLLGLGCGGGQKDARLLKLMKNRSRGLIYTPTDVSVAMVLVAQQMAASVISPSNCFPFVCDLASSDEINLPHPIGKKTVRLLTFFGMMPNFEPEMILPKLSRLVRPDDFLLISANLAPGKSYSAGVREIMPLYDNELTRDWLTTFLLDLGVEKESGELRFSVETRGKEFRFQRVEANFHFSRRTQIHLPEERFEFRGGDRIRLFFSYRYTPERLTRLLERHRICLLDQWITVSEEEGVFLCRKLA